MKRRLFSLFLALTLVVGMLPAPAFAQETEPTQVTEASTEAPATEAPATGVPATEAPATEAPAAEPTPAPTEALAPETTVAPAPTEAPTEPAPTEDEAVAAVQAMIDALPDVDHMSEEYIDALVEAYSAYETLSESQQAKITGVEKLEALFGWVNSQVSTLATEETISGGVNWENKTSTTPVKLTGDTTLTLTGTNRIECDQPLDLNGFDLTIQGTGTLELVGKGGNNYRVGATLCDSTYTSSNSGGALTLAGGTVKVSGSDQNAVCVYNLKLNGGKLEAYGGSNAGIACAILQTMSGSLYATGKDYGISMYRPCSYGATVNKLTILVSNKRDADPAEMESADENAIAKAGIGDFRTVYIGEVTGPMLLVKAQKGYLYEATAKTATFALSGRNVDLSALTLEWTGAHTGLEAAASADGKTLTVTTDKTVQAGTYGLKVSAGEASKTAVVTVSGPPICIYDRPVDTIRTDPEAGAVTVSAYLTKGHTGPIAFQWKQEDGTVMAGYTEETVRLYDLVEQGMLTQDASKPWLQSIRIYCTLSYDGYSLDTDTVTVGLSSCSHPGVDHEGNCLQCGQKKGGNGDALIVREDGLYHLIANAEPGEANVGLFMYSGGNFYLTGDVPNKTVNVSDTNVGGKDVTLDLQGHTLNTLDMGNFPYGTFTVKNGTLGVIGTAANGKLILENIRYKDLFISAQFDLTVQGENTHFELPVAFHGTTHLRGGHFEQGLDSNCAGRALELLEEGFAFYDSANEVVDATDSDRLVGEQIHVAAHTCHYSDGKCDCGRSCDHSTVSAETGLCQECGSQVYEANVTTADGTVTGYRTLEEALGNGANATVKLLADCVVKEREEAFYVKVPLTLDLNGKRMEGPSGLVVQNGPTTILDSSPAKTGTIAGTRDSEFSGVGLWVYKDANVTLTILGGHIEGKTDGLRLVGQNTLILKGGSFSSIHFIEGAAATLRDSLAPGYAYYKDADNTLYDPGDKQEATVRLHVGAHPEHTLDSSGHCPCGYTAAAMLDTEAGKQYFADFGDALEAAKAASGSTLTLFQDVALTNNIYIDSGTFTIDWNGHTISGEMSNDLLVITGTAKVTLTDSVGTGTTGGLRNVGGAAIGVYYGGSLTVQGGVYSPQLCKYESAYGSIQISGGRFENPEDGGRNGALYCDSGSLADLLAPGYTFAYEDDDGLFNVYQRKSDANRTVYVVEHTHDSFDENGVCDCGYVCPHEHWTDGMCDLCGKVCDHERYENGKCTVCGYPCPHEDVTENGGVYTCDICGLTMTVMVETADGNVSYTTDLAAALNNAEDGTTVKLLSDLVLTKSANIIGGNKTVTLNLNGHNITRATWQTIQVKGNTDDGTKAKLVITGSGEIRFNVKAADGGQLDMSGWTGTVAWVDLENACDFVGPIGDGHLGELNISNWRSDNKGTILLQGGTIGKLWLNSFDNSFQMTLGSLLKSGYAAKSGSEYLPYDHAISQSDDTLNDLTIEPCPHTGLDSSGRCTYCNATGFVATVTKDGVTAGYTDFLSALDEICDGKRGTLKLLKDVPENGQYVYSISGTLDLNGKNLAGKLVCAQGSNLQIVNSGSDMSGMGKLEVWNGAKVTIADTAGSILFDMVTVESGSVADLLPEGGVYFRLDMRTWISAAEAATKQTLGSVVVREAPVKSVTLIANKTSVPYGESQTVTLTASSTLSGDATASYAWAEVTSYGIDPMGEDEASFTLPAGVNAGEHTYRVSVTVGDYTLSKDIQITVTKAPGKLVNKDYPTEFTYGEMVPTPKAENFTSNHPDGTFSYHWKTGNNSGLEPGANPVDAGTYILYATWTGGTNYTTASLSLAVTIQKAAQTANITVVNETISGKGDGGVKLLPSADVYEIRKKGEATFEAISASQGETFHTLIPGVTYEIRLAETKNYLPSAIQEVTVQPGRKLEVILPTNQEGYTLTASKTQLDWHEDVVLTFQLNPVGAYKTADFGVWKQEGSSKIGLTFDMGGAVTLTNVSNDITITVTGVETDNVAPQASIRGRLRKDSGYYVKWEGFQKNPVDDFVNGDFVISATDRLSGMADFWYYLSDKPLTLEELKGMNGAFWARPANQGKVSITEDGEYYLYAKALDKANNAGYACTGKLVKESNPPTFSGVENGKTYYVTQMLKIHDDGMPDWYRAEGSIGVVPNGGDENPIEQLLENNGSSYTITAGDRCGNEASITVYMKPLTDLTQPLYSILEESIQKSDRATLDDVEATLKGLDVTYATEPEKKEINDALARIAQLRQVLDQVAAVEAQIDALPDSVEPYQQTVEDTQIKPARDAYNSLTDHQKTLVDSTKLDKLVRLEAQLDAWTITEGDGQTWYKGSGKSLSFTVNGQRRKFDGIRQENTYIGCNYSSLLTASGEVDEPFTLTLKPEFLQCQTPGEHSFTVYYSGLYSGYLSISVTYTVETPANYLDVTDREEFEGKTTVTVDGKEYPIEEMAGYLQRIPTQRYVNLPETGDLLTIYSFKDGTPAGSYTNYPTGMQVFRITRQEGGAKAEEITEFANLLNYAGCSIRLTGTKGIRMITGIGENARTALTGAQGLAGYTLEEYGTVVMRGVGTPTLEKSKSHNFAYKKGKADPVFARVGGMIQYTNVLVGFGLEDCKDTLTLRPYIILKDMTTGETVTLYGGCVSRSIGYIAKQNENTYQPGTAGYKYVHEIIDAVYGKTEQGGETK